MGVLRNSDWVQFTRSALSLTFGLLFLVLSLTERSWVLFGIALYSLAVAGLSLWLDTRRLRRRQ